MLENMQNILNFYVHATVCEQNHEILFSFVVLFVNIAVNHLLKKTQKIELLYVTLVLVIIWYFVILKLNNKIQCC